MVNELILVSSFQWGCLMMMHRELEKPMLCPPRDIIESLSPTGKFWYNNKTWSFPMQWAMQKTKGHNFIMGQQTWKNNLGQRERAPLQNNHCDLEAKYHTKDLAREEQRCDSKFDPKMQYAGTASLKVFGDEHWNGNVCLKTDAIQKVILFWCQLLSLQSS